MSGHKSYEESISAVYKGLMLLGFVTLVEVFFSLFGKGYIIESAPTWGKWFVIVISLVLIGLSLYKAYFIIYEFMHMGGEVRGLRLSVLLPVFLLVWGVIAFFHEGNAWKERRNDVIELNEIVAPNSVKVIE